MHMDCTDWAWQYRHIRSSALPHSELAAENLDISRSRDAGAPWNYEVVAGYLYAFRIRQKRPRIASNRMTDKPRG